MTKANRLLQWQRLSTGECKGIVRPLDPVIHQLRLMGYSLGAIAERIDKRKSYVQHRLLRIAARE